MRELSSLSAYATIIGLALVIGYYAIRWNGVRGRVPTRVTSSGRDDMPLAEARVEMARLINERLIDSDSANESNALNNLGPVTRDLFTAYSAIRIPEKGFKVDVRDIGPSLYIEGAISIGHIEDWDLVVLPDRDSVYVMEGSEGLIQNAERHSSIYHMILHVYNEG